MNKAANFFWFTLLFRHNGSRIVGNNHSDNIHHASSLAIYAGMIFRYEAFLNRLSSLSPLGPVTSEAGRKETRQRDLDSSTKTTDQTETLTAEER